MPEDFPTPEKSIQEIEKEQMARLKAKAKAGKMMLDEQMNLNKGGTEMRILMVLASGDYNHYESGENRQNQSKRNSHYYNQTKVPKICADQ